MSEKPIEPEKTADESKSAANEQPGSVSASDAKPSGNKNIRTAIFVGMLVGVVGIFQALNAFADPPPDLPRDAPHTLLFNNQNELIGIGAPETWPTKDASGKDFPLDKKAIERRVNFSCTVCHGAPSGLRDEEFGKQTTCAVANKCLPTHKTHPQKTTCIKCHRLKSAGAPSM